MKIGVFKPAWFILLMVLVQTTQAQKTTDLKGVLTADSLASGNVKDILTSFFQLSFDKLTGPKKELNFQSNPFAILLRNNPDAAIDTNYYKYRTLRRLNFGFGLNLDTSYRFNGFSSGVKFALIDKRDTTTSRLLFRELGNDSLSIEISALQKALTRHIDNIDDFEKKRALSKNLNALFSEKTVPFNTLDTSFQALVKATTENNGLQRIGRLLAKNPAANLAKESELKFVELKNEIKNALLWTVSVSDTTYKDQFFFSNLLLKTELLKGLGKLKPGSNWEFNVQAGVHFLDDSLSKGRDLKRALFQFEPGFNWVVRNKSNDQSFLEIKFSGNYSHHFRNLYAKERRDSLTLNATLRVRIISNIWVPLEIKYDPRSGNVFGFLNIRANFHGFRKPENSGM